jgi:hypothetical protein
MSDSSRPSPTKRRAREQLGWLEHTLSGIASSIERAVFTEEHAHKPGWLQRVDPRAKLGMFLALLLAASLSHTLIVLAALYLVILGAAAASQVPFDLRWNGKLCAARSGSRRRPLVAQQPALPLTTCFFLITIRV